MTHLPLTVSAGHKVESDPETILKYLAATADGSYFAFFIDLKEDEEILELILLAEKGDRVVFEFQQGEEKRCYVKDFINQTAHRKQLLRG